MKKKDSLKILDEEIGEEVLARMLKWFKKLRAEYRKRALHKKSDSGYLSIFIKIFKWTWDLKQV